MGGKRVELWCHGANIDRAYLFVLEVCCFV